MSHHLDLLIIQLATREEGEEEEGFEEEKKKGWKNILLFVVINCVMRTHKSMYRIYRITIHHYVSYPIERTYSYAEEKGP